MDGRTQPKLAKPSSWTCRRRRTLRPGRPRSMLQPSSQHRITSKPRRKDRGGHHLQLTHRGLQVRPKQRFQERNGAETPSLPCPGNWTKGFPRCPRRGSSLGHDSASMEVTAPSGVAVVSAGHRRAGISPGPRPTEPWMIRLCISSDADILSHYQVKIAHRTQWWRTQHPVQVETCTS